MTVRRKRKRDRRLRRSATAEAAIDIVLERYGVSRQIGEGGLLQAWPKIVGPRIAERTWPAGVRDGELLVVVSSSAWLQQLSFIKGELLESINAASDEPVTRVRLELEGRLKRGPTVQVARKPPERAPRQPPRDPLPEEHAAAIERETETVTDRELREIIAAARKRWQK